METSPATLTRGCMFISVMLKWNKSIQRHFSETRRPHSATARFASPQIQWLINHHRQNIEITKLLLALNIEIINKTPQKLPNMALENSMQL